MFEARSIWCPDLKQVTLYGTVYTVPKNRMWAAVDKDGTLWCFNKKPRHSISEPRWVHGGTWSYIGVACYTGEWTDSLIKLED